MESWRELQFGLHEEFAGLVEEAYHETNRWLVEHEVMTDVDLHAYIRRSRNMPTAPAALTGVLEELVSLGCRGWRRQRAGGCIGIRHRGRGWHQHRWWRRRLLPRP